MNAEQKDNVELCDLCKKPLVRFKQTIARRTDYKGDETAVHFVCKLAVSPNGRCPQCDSDTGVKIPREGGIYCEDCGWPDEDFKDVGDDAERHTGGRQ